MHGFLYHICKVFVPTMVIRQLRMKRSTEDVFFLYGTNNFPCITSIGSTRKFYCYLIFCSRFRFTSGFFFVFVSCFDHCSIFYFLRGLSFQRIDDFHLNYSFTFFNSCREPKKKGGGLLHTYVMYVCSGVQVLRSTGFQY